MIEIKIDKFEGPLDLLLKFIEKEKLDITEVSLAKIADQYVSYIENEKNINPELTSDFLFIAARLLLIKSRALLPYLHPEEEEEIEEFQEQLKMYKKFLDASEKIEDMLKNKNIMFVRSFDKQNLIADVDFFPPKNISVQDLKIVFTDFLNRTKAQEEKMEEEKVEVKISMEEKIGDIKNILKKRIKFNFSSVLKKTKTKSEKIVSFLAMLEMVRQREITAKQKDLFKEIIINRV